MMTEDKVGPFPLAAGAAVREARREALGLELGPGLRVAKAPLFGIDWAAGLPSKQALDAAGVQFVVRYLKLPFTTWRQDLTKAEAARHTAEGRSIVTVYESTASRATQGYQAGVADAKWARQQANAVGQPHTRPIMYACDSDVSGDQVHDYFRGVNDTEKASAGQYGGIRPTRYLFDHSQVRFGFQTYAWSWDAANRRTIWDARAKLQQYSNGHRIGGVDCDYNRGYGDFGQWMLITEVPPASRALKVGDQGTDVRSMQRAVNDRGAHHWAPECRLNPVAEDGILGPATWAHAHTVQKMLGLGHSVLLRRSMTVGVQKVLVDPDLRSAGDIARDKSRREAWDRSH